ncbi:acetyl-CoA carboxylase carboxyltransferase subunit beta [Bacteroidetes/Chlorobi group bacterium Naka2016]|jgi:acetyl-CoA carboxylase carboxyl transferase subunit beta|nr:MAG: acetyl-CoA carboxylase carboxyltransferase subunit beta [Bacteroidetes/Chlorobi group bacterium Naka2016]
MGWFLRSKENIESDKPKEMPDGLWTKCPSCGEIVFKKQLEENLFTCPKCNHHYRIGVSEYINIILDEGSFEELNANITSDDPLNFFDSKPYVERIEQARLSTGFNEALITGLGKIDGIPVAAGFMCFAFIGGSMGSAVGEKFYRLARISLENKVPLIMVCASGGARMQEAALSLMQMAKTSAILTELAENRIPYLTVLTDPTTGGVTASFGMLGDITIAEPGALIGFAGPRVIEQTIKKKLPANFQKAEFLLEKGFVDIVVPRKELKSTLARLIKWFLN